MIRTSELEGVISVVAKARTLRDQLRLARDAGDNLISATAENIHGNGLKLDVPASAVADSLLKQLRAHAALLAQQGIAFDEYDEPGDVLPPPAPPKRTRRPRAAKATPKVAVP
jgi:hypothetical protein